MRTYNELTKLIAKYNNKYRVHNERIKNATKQNSIGYRVAKEQFINEYVEVLHQFIWENQDILTKTDCVVLDLVPYTVWNALSGKYILLIDTIKKFRN